MVRPEPAPPPARMVLSRALMHGNGPSPTVGMKDDGGRPGALDLATIFAVSAAIMLYQLTLTRVLSVVVWYHFAFLTISLVMLGLGAPGVWFALSRRPLRYLRGLLPHTKCEIVLPCALRTAILACMTTRGCAQCATTHRS